MITWNPNSSAAPYSTLAEVSPPGFRPVSCSFNMFLQTEIMCLHSIKPAPPTKDQTRPTKQLLSDNLNCPSLDSMKKTMISRFPHPMLGLCCYILVGHDPPPVICQNSAPPGISKSKRLRAFCHNCCAAHALIAALHSAPHLFVVSFAIQRLKSQETPLKGFQPRIP